MTEKKYNEPEYKAGFTDEEVEKYGDAVLMNWRDWVGLREMLDEKLAEAPLGREPLAFWGGYRAALDEIRRTMDEMLP